MSSNSATLPIPLFITMDSPQMYDTTHQQLDLKKVAAAASVMANNNNNLAVTNNNNNSSTINHNMLANKQQQHPHQQQHNQQQQQQQQQQQLQQQQQQQQQQLHLSQLQQGLNNNNNNNNNNNAILQKQILQQYSQSDLEELASQEISLDLQHLIDDQFREQEALGMFSDLGGAATNNNNNNNNASNNNTNSNGVLSIAAKVLQQSRPHQPSRSYQQNALAYMPQPVHTGAAYTSANNSSDDNSSIGSDGTNIKEEPVDTAELRRLAANVNGGVGQFAGINQAGAAGGIYQLPPNYASNGNGNTFTTLTAPSLHHQGLPHMPGTHMASLKHKQLMSHRKHSHKNVDKGTDEYRRRRERNNIAVRKSREKAKVRSREVEEKVKALVKEKEALMRRLEEMTGEIQLHKQLYVHLMNHNNPEVNNICRNVLSLVSNTGDHGM